MKKYIKKNDEYEAIQWTGKNREEVNKFLGEEVTLIKSWCSEMDNSILLNSDCILRRRVFLNHYIIKDENGLIDDYSPTMFKQLFEEVKK